MPIVDEDLLTKQNLLDGLIQKFAQLSTTMRIALDQQTKADSKTAYEMLAYIVSHEANKCCYCANCKRYRIECSTPTFDSDLKYLTKIIRFIEWIKTLATELLIEYKCLIKTELKIKQYNLSVLIRQISQMPVLIYHDLNDMVRATSESAYELLQYITSKCANKCCCCANCKKYRIKCSTTTFDDDLNYLNACISKIQSFDEWIYTSEPSESRLLKLLKLMNENIVVLGTKICEISPVISRSIKSINDIMMRVLYENLNDSISRKNFCANIELLLVITSK